jgi:transcriptional regulator with XRE-family HTH domain
MTADLRRLIGRRLRAIRLARGLTQEAVAALLDRSVETISNLERGQSLPSLESLATLADRLGVELPELLAVRRRPLDARESGEERLRHVAHLLPDRDFGVLLELAESLRKADSAAKSVGSRSKRVRGKRS